MKVESVFDKGSAKLIEDSLLLHNPVFGVFDGVTSATGYTNDEGKTGGYLASSIAHDTFANGDAPLEKLVWQANDSIKKEMERFGVNTADKLQQWATTAAVVKIENESFNYIQIGDSPILIVYKDSTCRVAGTYNHHDQEILVQWNKLTNKEKEGRKVVDVFKDQLRTLRQSVNLTYGVLNGEKEMGKFLYSGGEQLKNIANIFLFTDGLILPKKDPQSPDDFDTFIKLFHEGGLRKVQEYVRGLEETDPHCITYPRYKQHDDIAAIAISF